MIDEHLTRDLFRAIHKGWRNPGDLAAIAMAHLFELCPRCRQEFESWRSELGEGVAAPEGQDFDAVLDRMRAPAAANDGDATALEAKVEAERKHARSRAEELLALPAEQRIDWIRKETGSHSGLLLAEILIEECRRRTADDPHEGFTLANLARVVLQHAPASVYAVELYARAQAYLANSIRVIGDLPRAEQVLADARYLLRTQAGGDRWVRAEMDSLEASLRLVQLRISEAIPLLLRALMTFRLDGSCPEPAARCLVKMSSAYNRMGDVDRAVGVWKELLRTYDSTRLGDFDRMTRRNVADAHVRAGRLEQAREMLEESLPLYSDVSELERLRASILVARVKFHSGDHISAEQELMEARRAFARRKMGYDQAQMSLRLAGWYLEQGRDREAEPLVEEALALFEPLQVPARTAAAKALQARLAS